jgi:hypothetical protein
MGQSSTLTTNLTTNRLINGRGLMGIGPQGSRSGLILVLNGQHYAL